MKANSISVQQITQMIRSWYVEFGKATNLFPWSLTSKNFPPFLYNAHNWIDCCNTVRSPLDNSTQCTLQWMSNMDYYMASSVSGQDEPNPALWLASRAGKMELSCPLRTTRRVPQEKFPRKPYNKSLIDQACSVKMAWYWPSLWTSIPSRSINTQKKILVQYPAILTSHLVNNPYIFKEN